MFWWKQGAEIRRLGTLAESLCTDRDATIIMVGEQRKETEKQAALAQNFALESEELRQSLETERSRRISAETIAEERKSQIETLRSSLERAEVARDSSISAHLADLHTVNAPVQEQVPAKLSQEQLASLKEIGKGRISPMRRMEIADRKILMERALGKSAAKEVKPS